jgi:HK97 family phage prohead protease
MTEAPEVRLAVADLEVRGKRVIEGRAVPFDSPASVAGYVETVRRGAFARTIEQGAKKLPLMLLHDYQSLPVGVSTRWEEAEDGLHGRWELNSSHRAAEALEMVEDGSLRQLSIGFKAVHSEWDTEVDPPHVVRTECALREVSLVPVGVYGENAEVTLVRTAWHRPTPRLAAARRWLDSIG